MGLASFPLSQSFYQAVKSALVLEMDLELMCCGADSNKALFTGSWAAHWKSLGAGDLRLWGCSGENQWHPSHLVFTQRTSLPHPTLLWSLTQPHPLSFLLAHYLLWEALVESPASAGQLLGREKSKLSGNANDGFRWKVCYCMCIIVGIIADNFSRLHCTVRYWKVEKDKQE